MSRHRACDDFHRTSEAVRRDYLGGPPLTRRQALGWSVGGMLALYTAKATPIERVLEAAAAEAAAAPDAPVLVSVFLPGGVDLLDTLVPLHDYGRYADLHPKLKVEGLPLASTPFGVHPSLAEGLGGGIKGLYERGKVGFLPGIDYANPDLSHFHSRHFWETGLITDRAACRASPWGTASLPSCAPDGRPWRPWRRRATPASGSATCGASPTTPPCPRTSDSGTCAAAVAPCTRRARRRGWPRRWPTGSSPTPRRTTWTRSPRA
jgi:hypothetical protein